MTNPTWYDLGLEIAASQTQLDGSEAQARECGATVAESLDIGASCHVATLNGLELRWELFPARLELTVWGHTRTVPRESFAGAAALVQCLLAELPLSHLPAEERTEALSSLGFLDGLLSGLAERMKRGKR